jgi:hypothetical protein
MKLTTNRRLRDNAVTPLSQKSQLNEGQAPEIIADIKRVAGLLSKDTVTASEYDDKGDFGVTTVLRRFKQWNVALQKAGLTFPNRQNIPEEELFENIANVWSKLGRQPYGRDLDKTEGESEFSLATYEKRFGSWNKTLLAFEKYLQRSDQNLAKEPKDSRTKDRKSNRRTSRKINWRIRAQVLIRDNCICKMCGASPAKNPDVELHVDHIKAWSNGGETVIENLRTLCAKCNIGKSDLDI